VPGAALSSLKCLDLEFSKEVVNIEGTAARRPNQGVIGVHRRQPARGGPEMITENDDKPLWVTSLYAATVIQAWYAAMNLHFAQKASLTEEDRVAILARVHSQAKQLEDYLVVQGKQPLPTRDLMRKFEQIALFSARASH
jgi:hypothetical protein